MSGWLWHRSALVGLSIIPIVALALAACSGSKESESATTPPPETKEVKRGPQQYSAPPSMTIDSGKRYTAIFETNKGSMTAQLFPKDAPNTVNNFVALARDGYYDGSPFHRLIKGFMIQTGTPAGLDATGPGYQFNDEPINRDYEVGTLAMANRGPNTNGSQFFICDADLRGRLGKNYTIFGQLTEGTDVLHQIASVSVTANPGGELSKPVEDVHIVTVTIREE